MNDEIIIPRIGRTTFFEIIKENDLESQLTRSQNNGYDTLYIPQIVDARIVSEGYDDIVENTILSPSVRVIGKSKAGNAVVVYAHVPHYFSNPTNITAARKAGLVNGAAKMPLSHFYGLLDLEDNKNVFVLDHQIFLNAGTYDGVYGNYGSVELSEAIENPRLISFFAGRERAERYFARYNSYLEKNIFASYSSRAIHPRDLSELNDQEFEGIYGISKCGVDDIRLISKAKHIQIGCKEQISTLGSESYSTDVPLARLLFLGSNDSNKHSIDFDFNFNEMYYDHLLATNYHRLFGFAARYHTSIYGIIPSVKN